MKKWIAFLLAVVMVLGLAACGGESPEPTGTNPSNAPAPSEPGTVQTAPVGEMNVDMAYTEMEIPALSDLIWQEQGEYSVAKTPFSCDADALYSYVQSDAYLQKNYPHVSRTVEEDYQSDETFRGVVILETITLTNDHGGKIEISLRRDVRIYSNWQAVSVTTSGIDLTSELQRALCGAFEQAGLSTMNYVVAARDPDGKGVEDGESLASDDQLQEAVTVESNVVYLLQRFVSQENPVSVFKVAVWKNPRRNQNYDDGAYTTISAGFPYHFADVVSADFGCADPFQKDRIGDALFSACNSECQNTQVQRLVLRKTTNSDETTGYTIFAAMENGDSGRLGLNMSYTMQGDQVVDSDVGITYYVSKYTADENSKELMFNESLRILEAVIDGLDTSGLVYSDGEASDENMQWACSTSVKILGCDTDAQIQVSYSNDGYEESVYIVVNQDYVESLNIRW